MGLWDKFLDKCVFIISFFLYNGFYAVLAVFISILGADSSRYATIPIRLLTTALMVIVIIYTIRKREFNTKLKLIYFTFFIFWVIYILKLLWHTANNYPLHSNWFEYIFYALNFSILPFFMFSSISFSKYKTIIINAIIFSGFMMGLTTTYLYKEILSSGVSRINLYIYENPDLETLNPLALSYASVLTIMLCVYKLFYDKNKTKLITWYLYITIGLSFVMFLLGASRGSILALVISGIYFILQSNFKTKLRVVALITACIPILIWGVTKTGSGIFKRSSQSADTGTTGREELWANAWEEFSNNIILGGRVEIGFHPHNIFLETLMATGIIGFIILIALFINSFNKITILPKIDKNYIWVAMILLQGLSQHTFTGTITAAVLVFFPLGIILSNFADIKN